MCLKPNECKIFLCEKNNNGQWEFRFSILENVKGNDKETIFVRSRKAKEFLKKVETLLSNKDIGDFDKIQRCSRNSLSNGYPLSGFQDMRKTPEYVYEKVKAMLIKATKKETILA